MSPIAHTCIGAKVFAPGAHCGIGMFLSFSSLFFGTSRLCSLTAFHVLDGKRIVLGDRDGLMNVVLPKYYRQTKLCSFIRQLNLYNFEKMKNLFEVCRSQLT